MNLNIIKCRLCNLVVIAEELEDHVCSKPSEVWVIEGRVWIGDGKQWIPLTNRKSTTDSNNGRFNRTMVVVEVSSFIAHACARFHQFQWNCCTS
jgi:hypothetical protein